MPPRDESDLELPDLKFPGLVARATARDDTAWNELPRRDLLRDETSIVPAVAL
jgi:hypothetical protein